MKYDVKYGIIKIEKYHNINLHVLKATATGGLHINDSIYSSKTEEK